MLTGQLTVDLGAIAANWRALDAMSARECETAAVVKADAYGCGIGAVGPALRQAGADCFFVATPTEGAALRRALGSGPRIHILAGYTADERPHFEAHALRPVLNAPGQVAAWMAGPAGPAMLQLDTGMNRLGLEPAELAALGPLPEIITHVISHLACADAPEHPQNRAQRQALTEMTAGCPLPLSLAATGGVLLGSDFHFALTRPGIGLYGGLPFAEARPVVTLEIPILQVREISPGEAVGYGATWVATRPSRIATIAAGYADGLIRAMGETARGFLQGKPVPFAGRVSMDLISLDVTDTDARPGQMIELLGPHQSVDDLARAASTIGYEILTSLGPRYAR
ncbi:MAG: alanine racemase, partial [Pseudomonadota bacterium]